MDSWEFNKIAGAVLAALLLAFGSGTLADIITGAGHGGGGSHGKPGYELPVTAAPSGAATPAAPKFNPADVVALLKGASPDSGKDIFRQCQSCHSSEKGDERKLQGPNLYGIVGRDRASHAGFNYSSALKTHPGKWTFEELAKWLHDPRADIPGNKMAFKGLDNNQDVADVISFLRTKSDNPVPLP